MVLLRVLEVRIAAETQTLWQAAIEYTLAQKNNGRLLCIRKIQAGYPTPLATKTVGPLLLPHWHYRPKPTQHCH